MSKAKKLESLLNKIVGEKEAGEFLQTIILTLEKDPVKAKNKINLAKKFL